MKSIKPNRLSVVFAFGLFYIGFTTLLRIVFILWTGSEMEGSFSAFLHLLVFGLLFDLAVASCFSIPMVLYLTLLPQRFRNTLFDCISTTTLYTLNWIILYFSFFAEITFWEEFKSRFNFIAVDYLIYTYEVVKNIEESYPLPWLISGILFLAFITVYTTYKLGFFKATFSSKTPFKSNALLLVLYSITAVVLVSVLTNDSGSNPSNRYASEITKNGVFSFFAAFRNNHLKFDEHYLHLPISEAFEIVKAELADSKTTFDQNYKNPLRRTIRAPHPENPEQKPNVILVLMESMSASFLSQDYKAAPITPNLNFIAANSIKFSNMFANGTRTVRGMEAVTLSIPPTSGNSIVKRVNNQNLYTISNVFKDKGYENLFFYGGDGYFDNMNAFYGGNGFTIYDRSCGSILSDKINTKRYNIEDNEVHFENAWGISDEDIYKKVIQVADAKQQSKEPFFAFVMTTSNHKPYTYPEGKIDIPSGTGRTGAVKYADYAIGAFLQEASQKEWFDHTVFIFVADHCASSAGKSAIDVGNHHIPAFIYNLKTHPNETVTKEVSQIDLMPTLFSLLNWNYTSQFYGKDVFDPQYNSRSFVATYIKLGLKKGADVIILSDQNQIEQFNWRNQELESTPLNASMQKSIISNYQTADYLFSNQLLTEP